MVVHGVAPGSPGLPRPVAGIRSELSIPGQPGGLAIPNAWPPIARVPSQIIEELQKLPVQISEQLQVIVARVLFFGQA